jgi:hydroxylaminobenzene mutase
MSEQRRRLAASGATLFLVGALTGLWAAAALTGKVVVPIPHLALATHLNAVLGALWQIAVALTLDLLAYQDRGRTRLCWLTAIPAWGNWLITVGASLLGVRGIAFTHDPRNNVIAVLLDLFVVLPTLAAGAMWAWGFRGRASAQR